MESVTTTRSITTQVMDLEKEYLLQNYGRYPLVLDRGEGAYVYDVDGEFRGLCNQAQVDLEAIDPSASDDEGTGRPQQRARSVEDAGMGDMLRHDAERLRILVERHKLHTGSKRAAALLDDALRIAAGER